ncbi:hypothetical protein C8J57DRAFT_1447794 [Mycena rebaudengoi]|nr:hypothetical protein C8J57DRAFT_1447794 [Mycena rebaudengoi]
MSDLYTTLQVSPRKKRCPPERDDDTTTPKKLRTAPPSPRPRAATSSALSRPPLPTHLARLSTVHTGLLHALSHALATCAVSPTSDTGIVRNVLNHLSLSTYTGLTTQFDVDDLRKLCWIWEWDGKTLPSESSSPSADEDNPFLDDKPPQTKDWTRGAMGIVLSPATHHSRVDGKRVPAYGIGIEVEMDIDKDMTGGMAAVARWTAAGEGRRDAFRRKMDSWITLHPGVSPVPPIPSADLPRLATSTKLSSLTRTLASASPKSALSSFKLPAPPSSPSRSPSKPKATPHQFAIPFPLTASPSKSPSKGSVFFPQTPSSRSNRSATELTPRTPTTSLTSTSEILSQPSTPVHQRGANATTVPSTPTSSRRQALYERVRQRSLTASPTKALSSEVTGGKLTRDQMFKMGQDELRRRCLLGRLGGVAESVWMLFSSPAAGTSASPSLRKRRALPLSEVTTAVIKSSPVPISSAEAVDSLTMLTKLAPFFLKQLTIASEAWLEMPAPTAGSVEGSSSPSKKGVVDGSPSKKTRVPVSPGGVTDRTEALLTRSPRSVKREAGGLREVREIIRRELEVQD